MKLMKKVLKNWSVFEIIWFVFAIGVVAVALIYKTNGFLSDASSICGAIYVLLIAKNIKYAYFFGGVNAIFYGAMLFFQKFYGISFYNLLYCFPMMILGYINWGKNDEKNGSGIKKMSDRTKVLLSLGIIIAIGIAYYITKYFGSTSPLMDSSITILGCTGIYLTVMRYIEQWEVWLIANSLNIWLWSLMTLEDPNNIAILAMWVIFFFNSLYGMIKWSKYMKEDQKNSIKKEKVKV